MERSWFNAAVFGIFKNNKWEILFQKRQNTWFADGYLQVPSWHIEYIPVETIQQAFIREMKEEIWIDIQEKHLSIIYTQFNCWKATKSYFNFFFEVSTYTWDIRNNEPDKCEELVWIHPDDFHKYKIIRFTILALQDIGNKVLLKSNIFDKKEDFLG